MGIAFRHCTATVRRTVVTSWALGSACVGLVAHPLHARADVVAEPTSVVGRTLVNDEPRDPIEACIESHVQLQLHEREYRFTEALSVASACTDRRCPDEISADCRAWSSAIEQRMPVVRVMVEAKPQVPVALRLDGTSLAVRRFPLTLRLDPGGHEIAASQDTQSTRVQLHLQPGETRDVTLVLLPQPASEAAPSGGLQWWQWGVGSVGVAALATFAVLGIQAQQARARASENCAPLCTQATVTQINQRAIGADVALGVAAASGIALIASWPSSSAAVTTVAVAPVVATVAGIRVDTRY